MSFRFRLLISFALLIAVTFGIGGTVLISSSFQSILNEEKASALGSFETMQNNLMMVTLLDDENFDNIREMFVQMEEQKMAGWQAVSLTTGHLVIYESGNQDLIQKHLAIPETEQYVYTVISDELGRRLQLRCKLVADNTEFLLNAGYDLSEAYIVRENQQRIFLIIYAVMVLLGLGMAGILSFVLTRRLRKLTAAVRKITEGELSRRSEIRTQDEFGQLSKDFDAMADKLQENIFQLELDVQRKEEFMGAFAHELKTPMTSIIGYADLLRQSGLNENDKIIAANYIFSEGKRLEQLSFKLLDLLMMEKDEISMKEVDLYTFLKGSINALSPMAKRKQVRLVWKGEKAKITMEPDLVKSLIFNLVDNAVKATGENGTVLVKGRELSDGVEFQIIDNGCGMEQEELSKITDAFYRVDKSRSRSQGGAGLGLSLCKKIVDLHHGTMTFHSIKGKGSCVIVRLHGGREDSNEKN